MKKPNLTTREINKSLKKFEIPRSRQKELKGGHEIGSVDMVDN